MVALYIVSHVLLAMLTSSPLFLGMWQIELLEMGSFYIRVWLERLALEIGNQL